MRSPASRAISATACGVICLAAAQQPQRPIFRGGTDLVVIDAYPRRNGQIVEGLVAADFELLEDGVRQTIEQFDFVKIAPASNIGRGFTVGSREGLAAAGDPRRRLFVVYLDVYHTRALGGSPVHGTVTHLLDRTDGQDDVYGFTTQGFPPGALTISPDPRAIEDALVKAWTTGQRDRLEHPQDALEERMEQCYSNPVSAPLIARHRMLLTMQHVSETIAFLGRLRSSRTNLMIVADGWPVAPVARGLVEEIGRIESLLPGDTGRRGNPIERSRVDARGPTCREDAMRLAMLDLAALHRQIIVLAQERNVAFYVVSTARLMAGVARVSDRLFELAHNTGGRVIATNADVERAPGWFDADTRAFYLLGYRSTNREGGGGLRHVRLRVRQPGVSVSARRTYLAPGPARPGTASATAVTVAEPPAGVVEALLRLPDAERPSGDVLVSGVEWKSGAELRVVVELGPTSRGQEAASSATDVEITATGEGGAVTARASARLAPGGRSTVVRVPVTSVSGAWRVSARVHGPAGVLTGQFILPPGSGLLVGDPILSAAPPGARSAHRPSAVPTFSRTARLRVEWPILSSLDRREARLLDRRGQPLPVPVTLSERSSESPAVLAADVSLAPLAPGDYVIALVATRGAETEERFVAIRVGR